MADLPAVQEYQSRVAEREQRVNSLTAELEQRNRDINEEQQRLSQSIRNVNFRRGPPVRPTVQKIKLLTGNFETNRSRFEAFQSQAQKTFEQENADVESSYQRALAAQQAESLRQQELASKYSSGNLSLDEFGEISGGSFESQFGKKSSDALEFAYYKYLVSHGKNLSQDEERNFVIAGGIIGKEARQELGGGLNKIVLGASVQTTKSSSTPSSDQKLIIQGEAVIYKYFNPGKNATVFVTSTGREYVQGESKNQVGASASQSIVPIKNLLSLKKGITTSEIKGDPSQASFVKANTLTEFGNFVANQGFQKGVRSKYDSPIPFPNKNTTNKFNKSILTGTPLYDLGVLELEVGRGILKGSGETLEKAKLIATPTVKVVADISRPIRQTTEYKNVLLASQQVSEAPFSIGAETYRRIANTGRDIGSTLYESTGLSISQDDQGRQTLKLLPVSERPKEYRKLLSDKEFEFYRERQAIVGGSLVAALPYAAGGAVLNVQRLADVGSAFRKSPEEAAKLVGVGIASTVLFNEIGSVGRVVKGQLGGTIAGNVGLAKTFENATSVGGKFLGIALLVPYAAQELPPLVSAFEKADAKAFQESLGNIQRTSASLFVGAQIGQKLSTGFTLFRETKYALTSGGLTAPTETLARKRLIANVFDVQPGTFVKARVPLEEGESARGIVGRITNTKIQNVDVYNLRKVYESKGFTKQKFLESYETIFNKLPGAKVTVKEFDPAKISEISNNPKAQKALLKYFEKNAGEFRVYGSTVQGPQLEGVKIRMSEDVDILAKDPKKFLTGLSNELVKSGVSRDRLDLFVGVEKSSLSLNGEKFLSAHPLYQDKDFFTQLENVGGVLPRRVFVQTPSGINLSNISFQAGRKVVGGFTQPREKDIADVLTIVEGVKNYISPRKVSGISIGFAYNEIPPVPGFVSKYFIRPDIEPVSGFESKINPLEKGEIKPVQQSTDNILRNEKFEFNLKGKIETTFGVIPKGTKLKDIARIGTESNPIKNISIITGQTPESLVRKFGEIRIDKFTAEQIKENPSIIAAFGFEEGEPAIGFRNIFQPGIPKDFRGGTQKLGALAHELTHAGENIIGVSERTANLPSLQYVFSGTEERARAVQQAFLESRGTSLPFSELFFTRTSDIKPLSIPKSTQGFQQNGFIEPLKAIPSNLNKVISGNSKAPSVEYYGGATSRSYPIFFPTKNSAYIPPKKISSSLYAPPKSVSSVYIPGTKGQGPNLPPTDNYVSPKTPRLDVPYTPPDGPPSPPLLPPDTPDYVPYTPPDTPSFVPRGGSPRPTTTFFAPPRLVPPRLEEKRISQKKVSSFVGFDVFVLKNVEGKQQFLEVDGKGTSLIQQDALRFGENVTDRSLEASFFIKQSRSPVVGLSGLPNLSSKFRISKQRIRKTIPVYVEIESYRLDTDSEVKKIHAARIAAQIRKTNLIKPKSRSKTTKRKPFGFNVI